MSAPAPKSPPSAPAPTTPATPPPTAPAAPPPANSTSPPPPAATPPTTPSAPPPAAPAPPPKTPASPPPEAPTPPPVAPAPPPANSTSPPPPTDTPVAPPPPDTPPSAPSPPSPTNPTPSNPSHSSPPPPSTSNSPPSSSSSNSVSIPVVVGAGIGAVVLLLIVSLICVCCWKKKKRRHEGLPMHYDAPPPPHMMYKEDPYARPYHQSSDNYMVKPSSDPGPPPPHPSRPTQPPPPPPPPAGPGGPIIYSGGSGSNYSGGSEPLPPPSPGLAFSMSKSTFTYEELVVATDGFSDANLLGQGGFGYVHKGVLPNQKEIAVKQLKVGSGQGEREFQAEVEIISRVHHKHLVSLVGYCISGGQRLLVYEFVPNDTLEFHLHGKGRPTMEWSTRLRIALGAAKGLAYLHEDCHPKIIHRDIKASNILLDYKYEAKVADFGLAKFTEDNNTHVSTRVMGTFGYLAPEYASSGKLTDKSDVFSYGVMLLELITGRRPVDTTQSYMDDSLVDWARPLMMRALENGDYEGMVDPKLGKSYKENEISRMIACAAACVRHSAKRRPRMSQVVRALEGDMSLDDLNDGGVKPGHSRFVGSYTSSDYDSTHYNEDMKKFRKMALQSGDYQSSQYSAPTSEYGLNPSGSSSEGGAHTREMEIGKMKKKDSRSQFSSEEY